MFARIVFTLLSAILCLFTIFGILFVLCGGPNHSYAGHGALIAVSIPLMLAWSEFNVVIKYMVGKY